MEAGKKRRKLRIEGVYTTGQAARICRLSQRIIVRCFNQGRIKGFIVPGGSGHRRIPKEALYKFIETNNIILE